jgi:surface antigen
MRRSNEELQPMLFPALIAPEICLWPRKRRAKPAPFVFFWKQLEFTFTLRDPIRHDLDSPFDFPTRRSVDAHAAPRVEVCAPRSVFDLAAFGGTLRVRLRQEPEPTVRTRIVRDEDSGVIRSERVAAMDTEEWREAERARRARQKPPKGNKIGWKKTASQKLKDMAGKVEGVD